jgi:DNA-binding NarL/FixJ family response regulator
MPKILLVDHPIVVQACRSLLEEAGVTTVFEAADPTSGYEAFVQHEPDVVVVDLRFHGQDLGGLALIERMGVYPT